MSQVADGTGDIWTYTYDSAGHLLSVTAPAPRPRLDDLVHLRHRQQSRNGQRPAVDHQSRRLAAELHLRCPGPAQRHQPERRDRPRSAYTYRGEAEVTATDAAGDQTIVWFNDLGLPARVEDPLGGISSYLYDDNGNLVGFTDAAGDTYQYTYDQNGNLTQIVNPLGQTVQMTYGSLERPDLDHRCRRQHDPVQLRFRRQPAQHRLSRTAPSSRSPTTRSATSPKPSCRTATRSATSTTPRAWSPRRPSPTARARPSPTTPTATC